MAFSFNGTSQYLTFSEYIPENIGTLAVFTKPNSTPSAFVPFMWRTRQSTGSFNAPFFGVGSGNQAFFSVQNGSSDSYNFGTSNNVIPNNTWTHACVTWNTSTAVIYINGQNSASSSINQALNFGLTHSVCLGARITITASTADRYFPGQLADIAAWNVNLTAAEIASLAKGMTPDKIRPQNLVFYAPLVRNLQDVRGGLTITNNNGATVANHPRVYA
jgi:urease beta subunit